LAPPEATFEGQQRRWGERHYFAMGCLDTAGVRQGPTTHWRPSGESYEEYKDGMLDGTSTTWSFDGTVSSARYRQDERNGAAGEWRDGRLERETHFVDGLPDGVLRLWFENGSLREESWYQAGERHGTSREWHSNGQGYKDAAYQQGKALFVNWSHENGILHRAETYSEGRMNGRIEVFDSNGRLDAVWFYEDGERVRTERPGGS
jgi:uncharacterized protein